METSWVTTTKDVPCALLRLDKRSISTSALARARADWLYGMNLTRAWTLIGRKQGLQSVLSIGRVQTPILGLIVKRDNEIKEFESIPAAVIVSEAVELATKYSTESSSPFINGVLAGICSKLRPEEKIS